MIFVVRAAASAVLLPAARLGLVGMRQGSRWLKRHGSASAFGLMLAAVTRQFVTVADARRPAVHARHCQTVSGGHGCPGA